MEQNMAANGRNRHITMQQSSIVNLRNRMVGLQYRSQVSGEITMISQRLSLYRKSRPPKPPSDFSRDRNGCSSTLPALGSGQHRLYEFGNRFCLVVADTRHTFRV